MIEVRNIKISVTTGPISLNNVIKCLDQCNISYKGFANFVSFNYQFSFVVFKTSSNNLNHINVSRVKSKKEIKVVENILLSVFLVPIHSIKVDNIVSTSNIGRELNLFEIVRKQIFPNLKYNPEQFPGLFVKFNKGTTILFHSGKIVIVGCKSYDDLKWVVTETSVRLKTL